MAVQKSDKSAAGLRTAPHVPHVPFPTDPAEVSRASKLALPSINPLLRSLWRLGEKSGGEGGGR
jgi:hypothetical protein